MTDRDVELLLERTAASLAYPATPQLRGRVLAAVAQVPQAPSPAITQRRPAFAFATVAAGIAVVAATIALAIPTSRTAIAEFFGIEGSKVERLPTPPPGATATPFPPASDLPATARPATLAEIESAIGFPPAIVGDDEPESSYLVQYGDAAVAILRYPSFDLWQTQLPTHFNAEKGVSESTVVDEFLLDDATAVDDGTPARWITGGSHLLTFTDATGEDIDESFRVVDRSTLIWRTDRAFYRLETTLSKEDAIQIANDLP
jgi:hypothetical protein